MSKFKLNYSIVMIYLSGLVLGGVCGYERRGSSIESSLDLYLVILSVIIGLTLAHFLLVAILGGFANFKKLAKGEDMKAKITLKDIRSPYDFISRSFKNASVFGAGTFQIATLLYFFPSSVYSALFLVKVVAVQLIVMIPIYLIYEGFYDIARARSGE